MMSQIFEFLKLWDSMFAKSMMKNANVPKLSILLQFGSEILGLLCSNDSIQVLLILSLF